MATKAQLEKMSTSQLFHIAAGQGPDWQEAAFVLEPRLEEMLAWYVRGQLGRHWDEWKDALQSTFLHAWEHRGRAPDEEEGFRRWLFVIAHAVCCNMAHRRRKTVALPEADMASRGPGATTQIRRQEERAKVRAAVDRLPGPLAEVVRLHYFEDLTEVEIAERVDETRDVIHGRLERGRELLRGMIGTPTWARKRSKKGGRKDVV